MSVNHMRLSSHSGFNADATITDDGRIDISIDETDPGKLAALLTAAPAPESSSPAAAPTTTTTAAAAAELRPPRLNIVIQVVGSRGDVQPFVALGHVLRRTYGHRVRLVTHAVFREFVEAPAPDDDDGNNGPDSRLEFFDIGGGDPAELMSFMVQNGAQGGEGGGLIPPMEAYTNGEIAQRRLFIEAVLHGCWRSMADDEADETTSSASPPFVADAIIANPPSFAHLHIAESLGVPLHVMFTMPWTPTRSFPHPLANLKCIPSPSSSSSSSSPLSQPALYGFACFLSYTIVECLTWQGLGDIINRFRAHDLGLEPLSPLLAVAPFHQGGLMGRLRVPTTYCWSPALLPKPPDWGAEITVAGYFFRAPQDSKAGPLSPSPSSSYVPSPDLAAFLAAGPPPVYVGFGSIVVGDPAGLTRTILDAVGRLKGVRAIVSKGWGGLGEGGGEGEKSNKKKNKNNVFFLADDCPHEWLFPRTACVVHHGGAGTTAAGLLFGVPTVVVPFFGDQPFWGSLVARAGAGPAPVPFSKLTAERLAAAIQEGLRPATRKKAGALGAKIRGEMGGGGAAAAAKGEMPEADGTMVGARTFHQHLDLPRLGCALLPDRLAVWQYSSAGPAKSSIRFSALAAAVLVQEGKLSYSDLKLFRAQEYHIHTDDQPSDPFSGVGSALLGDLSSIAMAVADFPRELFQKGQQTGDGDGQTGQTTTSTQAATVTLDTAYRAGRSVSRIVSTGLHSPLHFCLGLARGFHNAPRLYHDDTVRPLPGLSLQHGGNGDDDGDQPPVADLGGGLRAAGRAFGLGLFDGVTGLVTQPLRGAEREGGKGLVKGFAKGIGGVVLKPAAGAWSVPAYAMQGVQAEVQRLTVGGGSSGGAGAGSRAMEARREAARVQQGAVELAGATGAERQAVVARWEARR